MSRTNLENIIPIYRIGDGYAIAKDGSVTVGFILTLPEYDTLSKADFRDDGSGDGMRLYTQLEAAIKDLDEGYTFHQQDIIYYAPQDLPHYDNYLSKTVNRMYNGKRWLSNKSYMFITKQKSISIQSDYSDEAIDKIVSVIKRFRAALSQFSPRRMDDKDWLEYLRDFFSMQGRCALDLSFQDQKFGNYKMAGIAVLADPHIKSLRDKVRNNATSSPYAQRFNALVSPLCWSVPCYKIINNIISREDPVAIRKHLKTFTRNIAFLGKAAASHIASAETMAEIIETGESLPVYHHFNAFLIYPENEETAIEDKLDIALEKMQIAPTRLSLDFEHIFMSSIGGCCSGLEFPLDMYPTFLDEVTVFSNLEADYAQARDGIVLNDTHGKPVVVDIFNETMRNSQISNRNFTAIGPSGSGKSVSANKLISGLVQTDEYFNFILDDGESYEMLHYLMGEKSGYMRMTPTGEELSFNPFLIPFVDPKNDSEKLLVPELEMLTSLILLLWDQNNGLGLKDDPGKTAYIKKLLYDFYSLRYEQRTEYVNFDSFYKYIIQQHERGTLNDKYFDFDSFELVLHQYSKEGEWSLLLNSQNNSLNLAPQLRMCIVELKAVSNVKSIYKIVLYLVMLMAKKVLAEAPTKYKIFWLDEAWKLLDDPYFGDFIKYLYKTIRKEDSGIGLIVQDVPDIIHSEHHEAIINNSDTMFFLSHEGKEANLKKYQSELSLTSRDLEIILSMKKSDHAICIRQGAHTTEYIVQLSHEELALYTTSKEHKATIKKYIDQYNGNVQMAINAFCHAQNK